MYMPEHIHKRSRSFQDLPVDISQMRMALNNLEADLDGIEETEGEMAAIMEHVAALEDILSVTKKQRLAFSVITHDDLEKLGVKRKHLIIFDQEVTEQSAKSLPEKADAALTDLYAQIKNIYDHVNMDYEAGAHMILDAILLALLDIVSTASSDVAILPEARIGSGDGIPIINPQTGFELWLTGNVDYAAIKYDINDEDEGDDKALLLSPGGYRADVFQVAKGRLFLIKVKSQHLSISSYIPEAVSQAIALLKSANLLEVRFCLSDGDLWIFLVLKMVDGELTYYYSTIHTLDITVSDVKLREIIFLMCEWLDPTTTELFKLQQ